MSDSALKKLSVSASLPFSVFLSLTHTHNSSFARKQDIL